MADYSKTLDLACYIVNRHNELYKDKGIMVARLHKLIYFSNLFYYIKFYELYITEEDFIGCDFGPYLKSVMEEFSYFGCSDIHFVDYYFKKSSEDGLTCKVYYDESRLSANLKDLVNYVIDLCSIYETYELVNSSCTHYPYIKARDGYTREEKNTFKISNKDIIEFLDDYMDNEDMVILNKLEKHYILTINDKYKKDYIDDYIMEYGIDNTRLDSYAKEITNTRILYNFTRELNLGFLTDIVKVSNSRFTLFSGYLILYVFIFTPLGNIQLGYLGSKILVQIIAVILIAFSYFSADYSNKFLLSILRKLELIKLNRIKDSYTILNIIDYNENIH